MLFLMGRWDWNYAPIPIVLPLLSIGLARISIESTFVPGSEGLGAVIFTWIQIRL
jgi:palmitoyl transferase